MKIDNNNEKNTAPIRTLYGIDVNDIAKGVTAIYAIAAMLGVAYVLTQKGDGKGL